MCNIILLFLFIIMIILASKLTLRNNTGCLIFYYFGTRWVDRYVYLLVCLCIDIVCIAIILSSLLCRQVWLHVIYDDNKGLQDHHTASVVCKRRYLSMSWSHPPYFKLKSSSHPFKSPSNVYQHHLQHISRWTTLHLHVHTYHFDWFTLNSYTWTAPQQSVMTTHISHCVFLHALCLPG